MKIAVCIKQIPDTNDVRWTKDNNIIREGLISIINPYDIKALMTARKIKKILPDSEIDIVSMGPSGAINALKYALCYAGERAFLLSDKKFSGADTLATAYTLSCFIKNYDLIITGQFALDGDTAQTPYSLANMLNIPIIGYVHSIDKIENNEIYITSIKDDGKYEMKGSFPILISVSNYIEEEYTPLAQDYIRAQSSEIKILSADDIEADYNKIGIKGSPTYVSKAFRPQNKRECKFIQTSDLISEVKTWKY